MRINRMFYLENLGCAKNQVDAEHIIAALQQQGWQLADTPGTAEVIIVNTCGFINAAKAESIDISLDFKARYPGKRVLMAGCLTERYKSELTTQLPEIDGFAGNKNPYELINLVTAAPAGLLTEAASTLPPRQHLLSLPGSAYVKIAEGCNNHCAYCSIPLIRGDLRSRSIREITCEIIALAETGIFEFNLIAQDLASFGSEQRSGENLAGLLKSLAALKQDFWVRLLYIHPDKFPREILSIIRNDNRFLPYFDLPFQHASAVILRNMGRRGNAEAYLDLLREIRGRVPGAVIRSTFLVGFPGETTEDFQQLLEFQAKAALNWLGVFIYSREEGTAAYSLPGRVLKKVALVRQKQLEAAQLLISQQQLDKLVGQTLPVLIEEGVTGEPLFIGRAYAQAPEVDGLVVVHASGLQPGKPVMTRIIKRNGIDLEAVIEAAR